MRKSVCCLALLLGVMLGGCDFVSHEEYGEGRVQKEEALESEFVGIQQAEIRSNERGEVSVWLFFPMGNGCEKALEPEISYKGNIFYLQLKKKLIPGSICLDSFDYHEKVISLPVKTLAEGSYSVSINGAQKVLSFEL